MALHDDNRLNLTTVEASVMQCFERGVQITLCARGPAAPKGSPNYDKPWTYWCDAISEREREALHAAFPDAEWERCATVAQYGLDAARVALQRALAAYRPEEP